MSPKGQRGETMDIYTLIYRAIVMVNLTLTVVHLRRIDDACEAIINLLQP